MADERKEEAGCTCAVVGGSIAGLIAGLALTSVGIKVIIIDQYDFEKEEGDRGMFEPVVLSDSAIAKLKEWGVSDLGGNTMVNPPLDVRGWNGRLIRRTIVQGTVLRHKDAMRVFRSALAEKVNTVSFKLEEKMVSYQDVGWGVIIKCDGEISITAECMLGCDGQNSLVKRASLGASSVSGCNAVIMRTPDNYLEWSFEYLDPAESSNVDIHDARQSEAYPLFCRRLISQAPPKQISRLLMETPHVRRVCMREIDPTKSFSKHRTSLVGDAAHPMLPHTMQGTEQVINDMIAMLAGMRGLRFPEQIPILFERYSASRVIDSMVAQADSHRVGMARIHNGVNWEKATEDELSEHMILPNN